MPIIVLDPGHGGRDPGARGNVLTEKAVNLQACLILRDLLQQSGVTVLMTREADRECVPGVAEHVDLKARAMLANAERADLYVSWHYDASHDPNVHGVSVWIHPSQRGQSAYYKADLLAYKIAANTGQKNRGVYLGDFQVLRETMMDALLIEGGFITSPQEEGQLVSEAFLRRQAEGAAMAICQIVGVAYAVHDGVEPMAVLFQGAEIAEVSRHA
ncbi:N-acetylmuramoyl-L-alanine amidase [Tumebacillus sp. DT12]|uniref:N-acetylmuramoyl-L-alanine amidase n=1 Tax=Tumebacillus lacus TaxID=2995335 RepID=A0ABT3X118_9BACL|nr:N-acetylmuramoyl-L-alanine amidase [Tumebacillus lacus]MCX7570605.1 N-acetylmuramoyl-L-alanine amidase [Tumebacillus lacus]